MRPSRHHGHAHGQGQHGGGAATPTVLVSFKAGKLTAEAIPDSPKFLVSADARRGLLVLERAADSAMHLIFKDRVTLQVVDDLLVFPGDQTLSPVDTGRPDDRVYLLSFATSDARRMFFWMQDPDASKDASNLSELNRLMNAPPVAVVAPSSGRGASLANAPSSSAAAAVSAIDLGNILESIGLPPASSAVPPIANPSATSTTTSSSNPTPTLSNATQQLTQEALSNALRQAATVLRTPSLSNILTGDELEKLFAESPSVRESFLPLLPEGRRTEEELRITLRSPQFRQALDSLSKALQGDNLEAIMASFDLDPRQGGGADALARGDGIGAFIAAILAKFPEDSAMEEEE